MATRKRQTVDEEVAIDAAAMMHNGCPPLLGAEDIQQWFGVSDKAARALIKAARSFNTGLGSKYPLRSVLYAMHTLTGEL